ncbi:MAG: collagen-binding domain-containing protein, partial [Oscillospiraceae bacterium]
MNKPISERSLKNRLLSALTSVLVLSMTVVPSLNASADDVMVNNLNGGNTANNGYSKGQLSEVALLVGKNNKLADGASNAKEAIQNARNTYLLGIASQFCVFLENDFTPKAADSEGRVAVGGNVNFMNGYNYQIGSGDYASQGSLPLNKTDNYYGYTDFAHLIVGGNITNINTLSKWTELGSNDQPTGNEYYYSPDDDMYKRIVVNPNIDFTDTSQNSHYSYDTSWHGGFPYIDSCNHDGNGVNELAQMYGATLIDFSEQFDWLKGQSNKIANQNINGEATWNGNTLTLTALDDTANVIYFNVEDWNSNVENINFENIPNDANLIVTCDDTIISIGKNTNLINTTINGEVISNTGSVASNNNKNSERILYNFNNATEVYLDANFNGTVLSPNADVTSDDDCHGHLSGALVAKSFEGGLEFGYRPYQGTVDMLSAGIGYSIPILKVDGDSNPLADAKIVIKNQDTDEVVDSIISSGTTSDRLNIPTSIDYSGATTYVEYVNSSNYVSYVPEGTNEESIETNYTIQEISAPVGYTLTDVTYTVNLTEAIHQITVINGDTIPTSVSTIFIIDGTDGYMDIISVDINDTYSIDNKISTRTFDFSGNGDIQTGSEDSNIFVLNFDDNGKPSSVTDSDGNPILSDVTTSQQFTYNGLVYYYDVANNMITRNYNYVDEPITIENLAKDIIVNIEKVDQNGNALQGAIVDIYACDDVGSNSVKVASNVSLDSVVNLADIINPDYLLSKTSVKPGIYYLQETKAPTNATILDDRQYFKVNDDGSLSTYSLKAGVTSSLRDSSICSAYDWGWQILDFSSIPSNDIASIDISSIGSGGTYIKATVGDWNSSTSDVEITYELGTTQNIKLSEPLLLIQGDLNNLDNITEIVVNYENGTSATLFSTSGVDDDSASNSSGITILDDTVKLVNEVIEETTTTTEETTTTTEETTTTTEETTTTTEETTTTTEETTTTTEETTTTTEETTTTTEETTTTTEETTTTTEETTTTVPTTTTTPVPTTTTTTVPTTITTTTVPTTTTTPTPTTTTTVPTTTTTPIPTT